MENRLRSRGCVAEAGYKTWKEEEQTGMAEQRVEAPRANVDVDVKALPIGPEEAFVLSRVDGYASVLAISHSTGLTKERVQEILERLEALGAVHSSDTGLSGSRADAQRIDPQHVDSNRNNTSLAPSPHGFDEKPHAEGSPQRPSPARSTPSAQGPGFNVVPDIDLTADEQAEIWRAWSRIDQVDYYELLGVPRDASREVIREAYFARVTSVHPDKHFGRRLGSYKQKLETLFQHLTTAHETLARRRKRQVYDATLPSARPQARETSLPPPRASAAPTKSNGVSTAQRAAASTRTSVRPDVSAASAQGNVPIPIAPEAERRLAAQRALERGLRSVSISPSLRAGRPSAAPPPPARPEVRPTVSAVELAQRAAARGDHVTAARQYALAGGQSNDSELLLCAAQCYQQAAIELEDASLLRQAADNARRAVSIAPADGRFRLVLSRIYAEAGMVASSLREAERAQQLAPENPIIQSWLEQLRRKGA